MLFGPHILLCLFLGLEPTLSSAEDLQITFWIEPVQKPEFDVDVMAVMKELDALQLDMGISDAVVELSPNNEDKNMAEFCEILSNRGSSVIIDLSYSRWLEGYKLVRSQGIPYVRIGRMLRPFLEMFSDFMRKKVANNVAMIFQNARDTEEAVRHMMQGYTFRTLVLDASAPADTNKAGDFVGRLLSLRPRPTYYAVFGRGSAMNSIFERLQQADAFLRPTEWHFVFLDTRDRVFKYKRQVELATRFTLNGRALCRSMQMRDQYCTSGFTIQRAVLLDLLRTLIFAAQLSPQFPKPIFLECNATDATTRSADERAASQEFLEHVQLSNFLSYTTVEDDEVVDEEPLEAQPDAIELPLVSFVANISASFYSNEHEAKTDLAIWSAGELRLLNDTISPAKRFFRIGTAVSVPWSYYRRHPNTNELVLDAHGQPIWEGYCIDFMETLARKLNFEYEIVGPTRGHMGERDGHGGWDGVVGDLIAGETHFVIAALKMYSDREEVVDFLPPYYEQTGISIVMRKPVRRTSLFKFMTVLRLEVWLSIVAALIGTALMLWFMDRYSPYSSRNNRDAYPYPCREFTLRESFWFALTSFTPQGGGEAPKAISGRILVAAYWLFVVLMLATFTANLAAFLTVERMQTPVQSLEQLARQSRINYTVVEGSDTHQYFMNMKFAEDTLYRMWKELALNASDDYHKFRIWDYPIKEQYGHILLAINGSDPVSNASEGFRKVDEHLNADYAFIHDAAEIKYELTRNCNFTEVGEVFAEQPYAVAVQQGSHLGDELSYAILELQKDRFFEDLKAKYWNLSNQRNCPASEDQEGITLESLGGVFIATLFGLVLAMITLGVEVMYYQKRMEQLSLTQVKPLGTNTAPAIKRAWHTEGDKRKPKHLTPPPSFEAATFRGKKLPTKITLGDGKFKPRLREHGLQSRRELDTAEPDMHSGYME